MSADRGADIDPELLAAIVLGQRGELELARERFEQLWRTLAADDHFHRALLAHYLADLQPEPAAELEWDRRALEAALAGSPLSFDGRLPGTTWAGFFPSLHLNLAASYEKVGALAAAREHARLARTKASALTATPLGELTRSAIERICAALGVEDNEERSG